MRCGTTNHDVGRILEEMVVAYYMRLFLYFHGAAETTQARWTSLPVVGLILNIRIVAVGMCCRNPKHYAHYVQYAPRMMGGRVYKSSRKDILRFHWATGWTIGVLGFDSRRELGICLFTTATRTARGPTQPPIQWKPGAVSLRVKRPGREADHSPPSSAAVKECVELYFHSVKAQGQLYLLPFTLPTGVKISMHTVSTFILSVRI
jgi:hypothetical protein